MDVSLTTCMCIYTQHWCTLYNVYNLGFPTYECIEPFKTHEYQNSATVKYMYLISIDTSMPYISFKIVELPLVLYWYHTPARCCSTLHIHFVLTIWDMSVGQSHPFCHVCLLILLLEYILTLFVLFPFSVSFRPQHEDELRVEVRRKRRGPSLVLAMARTFGSAYFVIGILKLLQDLLLFANPQILKLDSWNIQKNKS